MDVDRLQVVLLGLGPGAELGAIGFQHPARAAPGVRVLALASSAARTGAAPRRSGRGVAPIGVVLSPDSIGISARTSSFFASRMASPSRGDGGLGAVIATLVLPGSVYVTHACLDLLEKLGFPGATGRWPSSSGSPSSLQSALTP